MASFQNQLKTNIVDVGSVPRDACDSPPDEGPVDYHVSSFSLPWFVERIYRAAESTFTQRTMGRSVYYLLLVENNVTRMRDGAERSAASKGEQLLYSLGTSALDFAVT